MVHHSTRVVSLLERLRLDFPRRKQTLEAAIREAGLNHTLELIIDPPEVVSSIPTFHPEVARAPTPMLRDRFNYAGTLSYGLGIWLPVSQMSRWLSDVGIREHHRSRREFWTNSAPMLFDDERLSLFGVKPGLVEDAEYLVWAADGDEPEIWRYVGTDSWRFANLEEYLEWCLTRE